MSPVRQGPLAGVRIVEFGGIGPGPMCCMLLGDLGADVVRIDRLGASGLGVPLPRRFDVVGRNRRSIALDLKQPRAIRAALALIAGADGLVEGFRPGVMERLGLGPVVAHAANPRLVYGRMTGFGQTGPLAPVAGHDITYIALGGALNAIGRAGERPVPPLNLVGDYGGGALYLAFGLLAGILRARETGVGDVIDAAMIDGVASLMAIFTGLKAGGRWSDERGVNLLDGGAPFYDTYVCADGLYFALGAIEPKFFATLARIIGLEGEHVARQYDRAHWPALRAAITAAMLSKTRAQWAALLEHTDACAAPVLTLAEAAAHPHLAARGCYVTHGGVTQPAVAPRFQNAAPGPLSPAPETGAHTRAILAEGGFSDAEIADLIACGAAADA